MLFLQEARDDLDFLKRRAVPGVPALPFPKIIFPLPAFLPHHPLGYTAFLYTLYGLYVNRADEYFKAQVSFPAVSC